MYLAGRRLQNLDVAHSLLFGAMAGCAAESLVRMHPVLCSTLWPESNAALKMVKFPLSCLLLELQAQRTMLKPSRACSSFQNL